VYQAGTLTYTRSQLTMLFFWLLWGDFCYILMESVVPSILPLKFQEYGASNTSLALVMMTIPMLINTVLNPIISFKSDRYRSRWGRRIPFILFTVPVLAVFLIGVGYGDKIGLALHPALSKIYSGLTPNHAAILMISVLMTIFSFFNTFVNSVFWYLFNDVVPEHLLARFMSWFRMVSTISASCYSFFLFKHGEAYAGEICVGAAILYVLGFGMMCFHVKEGQYPPAPKYVDGQSGPFSAIKTYARECHSLSHYWYVFLVGMSWAGACAVGTFAIYYNQAIGLNLDQMGKLNGTVSITMSLAILISGWLADKYHPIRIVIVGYILQICVALPLGLIWLFWHPSSNVVFYFSLVMSIVISVPAGALVGVLDPPMFMRVFPRERYGQFCSCNAMWRSISLIINGALAGLFFDIVNKQFGPKVGYCLMPLWQILFTTLALFFMIKLYRSWKRYGGDEAYVPPIPETSESKQKQLATAPAEI
jgi:MFS family permease